MSEITEVDRQVLTVLVSHPATTPLDIAEIRTTIMRWEGFHRAPSRSAIKRSLVKKLEPAGLVILHTRPGGTLVALATEEARP